MMATTNSGISLPLLYIQAFRSKLYYCTKQMDLGKKSRLKLFKLSQTIIKWKCSFKKYIFFNIYFLFIDAIIEIILYLELIV